MFHPLTGVTGVFEERMEGFKGPLACSILCQEFYESDPDRDFVRGYGLYSGRFTTPMTYALGGYVADDPIAWGAEHRRVIDDIYPYCAGLTVVTEDLPEETNSVTSTRTHRQRRHPRTQDHLQGQRKHLENDRPRRGPGRASTACSGG